MTENSRYLETATALAPLAGSLAGREAGLALASALQALASLNSSLKAAAQILDGLVAMSPDSVSSSSFVFWIFSTST